LITATLTLNVKTATVFAQNNNSPNSTNSTQTDNQTTAGVDKDRVAKLLHGFEDKQPDAVKLYENSDVVEKR
jgi:hypothetical protein